MSTLRLVIMLMDGDEEEDKDDDINDINHYDGDDEDHT